MYYGDAYGDAYIKPKGFRLLGCGGSAKYDPFFFFTTSSTEENVL